MSTRTIADRYTVTGRIGAGGGGVVWRATDDVLGRTVAVKEVALPTHLPEAERVRARTRALREAQSAARLEHPSVVSIYDVIEGDDALHIVMEHIDAPSLAALVSRAGPLSPERAAAIGLDVLEGLAAAHRVGVIHRDVKPSNVLVPEIGPAVVTDFGVAAVLGETGLTLTGEAMGTPDYISPEQLKDGPVGPPCDLWALGATLYDAVEGVPPFQRDHTMATIHGVASAEPRPTERAGSLDQVLRRLLVKDPAERPDVDTTRELLRTARQDAARQGDRTQPIEDRTRQMPAVAPTTDAGAATTASLGSTATTDHGAGAGAGAAVGAATTAGAGGPDTRPVDEPDATAPHPPDRPPSSDADRSGERRRAALVLGVLVAATAGVAALWLGGDGDTTPDPVDPSEQAQAAESTPAEDAEPTTDPAPDDAGDTDSSTSTDDEAATGEAAGLPDGWRLHDGGDYEVGVPGDWTSRDAPGSAIDLVAPAGDSYLRIGDTDDPAEDVLADTERIRDSFRSRYDTYEEVSLEPVEYRGHDAVRWEYTYTPGDRTLRAVHLNFSTGERGYALNYQAPAAAWDEVSGRFDAFTSTFRDR